jgi:hypothetical protein
MPKSLRLTPHTALPHLQPIIRSGRKPSFVEETMVSMKQVMFGTMIVGAILVLPLSPGAFGKTKTVFPTGEYAEIDVRLANETIKILDKGTPEEKERAIQSISANPENYAPPVFYVLSHVLFAKGNKDEAAFWFYLGQLRARFDANRSTDTSTAGVFDAYDRKYGQPINQYTFKDLDKLEKLITRVMEWDRKTPHNYDHRWISSSGINAWLQALNPSKKHKPLSRPKEEWDTIAEDTRSDYYLDFQDAMYTARTGKERLYRIRRDKVFFRMIEVKGADATSFHDLGGGYGKDNERVYYSYTAVEGADSKTFVVLGSRVSKDAKSVYFKAKRCKECDLPSFRKASEYKRFNWYTDKNAAYRSVLFHRIPGIEQKSFQALSRNYAKDRHAVWYTSDKVIGADPTTFKLKDCGGYDINASDKNRCYWAQYVVPCDCRSHKWTDFPPGITSFLPQASLIANGPGPYGKIIPVNGVYSSGYFVVAPGKQTFKMQCPNNKRHIHGKKVFRQLTIDIEPNQIYRLNHDISNGCGIKIERPAFVRGNADAPEIRLKVPGHKMPAWEAELPAGKHKLTTICREVTRERVIEVPVELTLDLKPGSIYQLSADFAPSQRKCDVKATRLSN